MKLRYPLAGGTVAGLVFGAWLYGGGLAFLGVHGGSGELPVVEAPPGPIKVRPDDPGGLEHPHAGLEVAELRRSRGGVAAREDDPGAENGDIAGEEQGDTWPAAVQVASLRSEADATREWERLMQSHGELLRGTTRRIESASVEGTGTVHRLFVGPFESVESAARFCERLRERGGDCIVGRP